MKTAANKNFILIILLLVLAFNFADRFVLGMVMQDIKQDLELTDSQLGFLTGIAFTLFYAVMGIPIARWADKGNRVAIISATVTLWSIMVALCGAATSFIQLLLIRVGVAVGEAGCLPPANSLIADIFSRAERSRATGIFMLGIPLSTVIGYFIGGWVNELYGWRTTFIFVLALPGMILAPLVWLTIREPRCKQNDDTLTTELTTSNKPTAPSAAQVFSTLWKVRTFRHLLFGFAVGNFFAYGIVQWLPAFFIRSHGMATGEIGIWFAVAFGLIGGLGTYFGGYLVGRYAASNERLQLRTMGVVYVLYMIASLFTYLPANQYMALFFLSLSVILGMSINGPIFAIIQTLVPEHMRATGIALIYLFANLIGLGLGPLAVGILSDALASTFGSESLRYALMIFSPGYCWVAAHFWFAGNTVKADIELVQHAQQNHDELRQQIGIARAYSNTG